MLVEDFVRWQDLKKTFSDSLRQKKARFNMNISENSTYKMVKPVKFDSNFTKYLHCNALKCT